MIHQEPQGIRYCVHTRMILKLCTTTYCSGGRFLFWKVLIFVILAVYVPTYYKLAVTEESHEFWLNKFLGLRVAEMSCNDDFFQIGLMKKSVCGHSFIGFCCSVDQGFWRSSYHSSEANIFWAVLPFVQQYCSDSLIWSMALLCFNFLLSTRALSGFPAVLCTLHGTIDGVFVYQTYFYLP